MNRGQITARPEQAVSYNNPNVYAPSLNGGGAANESGLAIFAAAAFAGVGIAAPVPHGNFPTAAIVIAAAIL